MLLNYYMYIYVCRRDIFVEIYIKLYNCISKISLYINFTLNKYNSVVQYDIINRIKRLNYYPNSLNSL